MSTDDDLPSPEEILATHDEIEEVYDMKYTGAAVAAPRLKLCRLLDEIEDGDRYHRGAQLLRDLLTAHFFEDGNKRTSWATTLRYFDQYDETPAETGDRVPKVLRRIRRYDVEELAEWLETGEIDEERLGR